MLFKGLIRKIALGKSADALEQEGRLLESGKEVPMNPKLVTFGEGLVWAFAAGAIASAGTMPTTKAGWFAVAGAGFLAAGAFVRKNVDIFK